MNFKVAGFAWDHGNRRKCQKHGVSLEAVESAFHGTLSVFPDPAHSEQEERFKAIGRTEEGRHVFIVFTFRAGEDAERLIRPISARYMHRKEIEHYEQEAAKPRNRPGR